MFAAGKSRSQFCARHNIARRTFDVWLDKYPIFADAYDTAQEKAKAFFDQMAMDNMIEEHQGSRLNTRLFEMTLRNRFEMPQNRIVKLRGMTARTSEDKLNAICEAIEDGSITPDEAQKLASVITSGITARQYDEFAERIEQIERLNRIGVDEDGFKEE